MSVLLGKKHIGQIPMRLKLAKCIGPTGEHWWSLSGDLIVCKYCDSSFKPEAPVSTATVSKKAAPFKRERDRNAGMKRMLRGWEQQRALDRT